MTQNIYVLGYISPIANSSCFITPVIRRDGMVGIQDVLYEKFAGIIEIYIDKRINIIEPTVVTIGEDEVIYGFKLNNDKLYFGRASELVDAITKIAQEIPDRKSLARKIDNFVAKYSNKKTEASGQAGSWTESRVQKLAQLWSEGLPASEIARILGNVTRNAVIGKVHTLGMSGRSKYTKQSDKPVTEAQQGLPIDKSENNFNIRTSTGRRKIN